MESAERTDPSIGFMRLLTPREQMQAVIDETHRLAEQEAEEEDLMTVGKELLAALGDVQRGLSDLRVEVAKINSAAIGIAITDHETRIRALEETRQQSKGKGMALEGSRAWFVVAISSFALVFAGLTFLSRIGVL